MSDRTMAALRAVAAAIITIAGIYGFNMPVGEEMLYSAFVCLAFLIVEARIWWRNNNVTDAASDCQVILDAYKNGDPEVIEAVADIIELIHSKDEGEDDEVE